jgi:hypothetical protein
MVQVTYNINNNNVVHNFPKYYECDKNWFSILDVDNYIFVKE